MINSENCLLVNPKFETGSFLNYNKICELFGARYFTLPLGLITVASLLPKTWNVRLIDCNVSRLTTEDIEWSDIIMSGGMSTQQDDHLDLIKKAKKHNKFHVVGGPEPTESPHIYDHAGSLVLGEAELTMPLFLNDYIHHTPKPVYEVPGKNTDMVESPVPRFDLLQADRYLYFSIQISRGCPFSCEFCNVLALFGKGYRIKSIKQILDELQHIYELGYRGLVQFNESNFIGNERAIKKILLELKTWQDNRNRPFIFGTWTSINLADDKEMMINMRDAGFTSVNIGIESSDKNTLLASNKEINTNRSIPQSIHTIYKNGISVIPSYVLGFDNDQRNAYKEMINCIDESSTPMNTLFLLIAFPKTDLADRLHKEGRLADNFAAFSDNKNDWEYALNFETLRPKEDIFEEYISLFREVYKPVNFFRRLRASIRILDFSKTAINLPLNKKLIFLKGALKLVAIVGIRASYKTEFWLTVFYCLCINFRALPYTIGFIASYHYLKNYENILLNGIENEIRLIKQTKKAS